MKRLLTILLLLFGTVATAQQPPIEYVVSEYRTAKSAVVAPVADGVLVFADGESETKAPGLLVDLADNIDAIPGLRVMLFRDGFNAEIPQQLVDGRYFAPIKPTSSYMLYVSGIDWDNKLAVNEFVPIVMPGPPDDQPGDEPQPPPIDSSWSDRAFALASALNDPTVSKRLGLAYQQAAKEGETLELDAAVLLVQKARASVLESQRDWSKDWASVLESLSAGIDDVPNIDAKAYCAIIYRIGEGFVRAGERSQPTTVKSRSAVMARARGDWIDPSIGNWSTASLYRHLLGDLGSREHVGKIPAGELTGRSLSELRAIHNNLHEGWSWDGSMFCPSGNCPLPR